MSKQRKSMKQHSSTREKPAFDIHSLSIFDSLYISEKIVQGILDQIEQEQLNKETLKKMPQYACRYIMDLSLAIRHCGFRPYEQKLDDKFLLEEVEPIPIELDSYQQQKKKMMTAIKIEAINEQLNLEQQSGPHSIHHSQAISISKSKAKTAINNEHKISSNASEARLKPQHSTHQRSARREDPTIKLDEKDWVKVQQYEDGITDEGLDNLRKFVIKRREFISHSKKNPSQRDDSKMSSQMNIHIENTKQPSHIFEKGQYIKFKKINVEKLPKINNQIRDIEATEGKSIQVEKTSQMDIVKDKIKKMKERRDKQMQDDIYRIEQEELAKKYNRIKQKTKLMSKMSTNLKSSMVVNDFAQDKNKSKDDKVDKTEKGEKADKGEKTEHQSSEEDGEEDLGEKYETNEEELKRFNIKKKLAVLLKKKKPLHEHVEPKQMRELIHPNYGVAYSEDANQFQKVPAYRNQGKHYMESPLFFNRMRKADLMKKQEHELEETLQIYLTLGRSSQEKLNKMNMTFDDAHKIDSSLILNDTVNKSGNSTLFPTIGFPDSRNVKQANKKDRFVSFDKVSASANASKILNLEQVGGKKYGHINYRNQSYVEDLFNTSTSFTIQPNFNSSRNEAQIHLRKPLISNKHSFGKTIELGYGKNIKKNAFNLTTKNQDVMRRQRNNRPEDVIEKHRKLTSLYSLSKNIPEEAKARILEAESKNQGRQI